MIRLAARLATRAIALGHAGRRLFRDDDRAEAEAARLLHRLDLPQLRAGLSDEAFKRIRQRTTAAFLAARQSRTEPMGASGGRLSRQRRITAPGLAAGLGRGVLVVASLVLSFGVLTGSVLAESRPGHSLYPVRLALENLTLPAHGSAQRIDAQLSRLDQRVRETQTASDESDGHAVDDAVTAYRETLLDVAEIAAAQPAARERVTSRLHEEGEVLHALANRATAEIRTRIDEALAETWQVTHVLHAHRNREARRAVGKAGSFGGQLAGQPEPAPPSG